MGLLTGGGGSLSGGYSGWGGTPTQKKSGWGQGTSWYQSPSYQQPSLSAASYNPYAYDQAAANAQVAYAGLQMGLTSNQGDQRNASAGLDNRYADQQMGFANQTAGLAHQLLGLDRRDLGIDWESLGIDRRSLGLDRNELALNRKETTRQSELDKWRLGNELAGRGAYVTPGSRFQHADLAQQLSNAMAGYDIEGHRIDLAGNRIDLAGKRLDVQGDRLDVKGNQIDVNLAEQLAGYQNRKDQNAITQKYGSTEDYLKYLGMSADQAAALVKKAQADANYAAYLGWLESLDGSGAPGPGGQIRPEDRGIQ